MSSVSDQLNTVRWKKFGKDRLYVNTSEGSRVGFHDLLTGEAVIELDEHAEAFHLAVASWMLARPSDEARPVRATVDEVGASGEAVGSDDDGAEAEGEVVVDPEAVPIPEASISDLVAPPSWTDLAHNAAGASARREATRQRQAAPVRTLMSRALGLRTDERAWRIGAGGEEKVAAQLAKLAKRDKRWRYLHAIPVGKKGSDIDHLVVGPGGVYSLNAKRHPGANLWIGGNTFMVNGHRQDYVRNSRFEAERASRLLTASCGRQVHVMGVIVPVDAKSITIKSAPTGVGIVNRMGLMKWLAERGTILDEKAVDLIFEAARRSTTWET